MCDIPTPHLHYIFGKNNMIYICRHVLEKRLIKKKVHTTDGLMT